MTTKQRIGLLTSGGDYSDLNAVLRAVVRRVVIGYDWDIIGIENGTLDLLQRPVGARPMTPADFNGTLMRQSGTFLVSTNTVNPFTFEMPDGSTCDRSSEVAEGMRELGLDGLIGIGGDGTLALLKRLADLANMPLICIPKTIDNDVGVTEVAIGYDTGVHVATEALDRLQPTAARHGRVIILEVMGWDAGLIAFVLGIAGGADVILIPEISYDLDVVAERLESAGERGYNIALMIVAGAVTSLNSGAVTVGNASGRTTYGSVGDALAAQLSEMVSAEIRVTVLGHVQRGGLPTARDRLVAWRDRQVIDVPTGGAISAYHVVNIDGPVVATARGYGISLGDT